LERRRQALEARIAALQLEFEQEEALRLIKQEGQREEQLQLDRAEMARVRR
jgi:hypothetical protein